MTTVSQTSEIISRPYNRSRKGQQLYKVVINAEDGNYQEFEIEASSLSEAEAKANEIAYQEMTDITYVEIYKIA
jgi:hypothetical protein